MFVLEYIRKKNFLNKKNKEKLIVETDIVDNEELNLEKFREEVSNEIGAISIEEKNIKSEGEDD